MPKSEMLWVKIQDLLINYTEEVIHVLWSVHGDSSSLWLISLMWFSHAWLCSVWVWRFQSEVSLRTRELRLSMWLSRSSVSSSGWSSPPSSCNVEECRLEIILVARTTLESDYIIMMTYWPSFNVSAYLNVLYVLAFKRWNTNLRNYRTFCPCFHFVSSGDQKVFFCKIL